jgi:hypothetical protein
VHDDWPFYTDQEKQILKRYGVQSKWKSFFTNSLRCTPFYLLRGERMNEKNLFSLSLSLSVCHGCHSLSVCVGSGSGDWSDCCCNLGQFGTSCLCVLRHEGEGNWCLCVFFFILFIFQLKIRTGLSGLAIVGCRFSYLCVIWSNKLTESATTQWTGTECIERELRTAVL